MILKTSEKNRLRQQYGPWAVVTGASSGIGLELARLLADAGLQLVINARQIERLAPVAQQLRETYGIDVRMVAADVSAPGGVQQLIDDTDGLDVGLLVLSAGFGTSGLFLRSNLDEEINLLRVNAEAVLSLTHHFGRRFAAQHRGGIILLSSMVAFQGVPYAANYAASKAYVQSLAEALALELKPDGVDVLAAAPGPVRSGFEQRANMAMTMSLTPEQVGVPILRALGRQTTVLPGWLTKLLVYALRTVPRWGKVRIMQQVMGGMTQHQRQLQPNP
ncbi:SDR family NAD(P)-dependent oxidoreductase [Fibrisoma montanum]|uniref:SDR family NAD(P)-dependent oxidoreductase n=1 Tax=Fibrisoma montanum TaxID=2305895 RepID=A0A418MC75_9BACT|nr:SDR family NAD(P)-dependent oxidoreductase [Fibrisoma montanum]RIV23971.1 SDR family NAD(P)-dependent oxidoreductase [Fibrisoma montanum]